MPTGDRDRGIHFAHPDDVAAAHIAGIGLDEKRSCIASGAQAGSIIEDPLVPAIGGVPVGVVGFLRMRVDLVMDREISIAINGCTKRNGLRRSKDFFLNGRQNRFLICP